MEIPDLKMDDLGAGKPTIFGKHFFFFGVPLVSRATEMMATSFVVPVGEVLDRRGVGSGPENFRGKKKHGWKNPGLKKGR